MTPILGILASGISGNLETNSYESIATITPYTTTTTVAFSSIPSTYRHLQLRAFAASSAAANYIIRINGDTANNYSWHYIEGSGTGTGSVGNAVADSKLLGGVITNTGSMYTSIIMDFLDYKETTKYKTSRSWSGVDLNGSSTWLNFFSGIWNGSSAINNITISLGGATFAANSHWALYGIKG